VFLAATRSLARIARFDVPALIEGETGTGKELAARVVHYQSARGNRPFIPVNCGALPETLVENELFGHERGAYTDARESMPGVIALAEGGTLFLDEIETLSVGAQASSCASGRTPTVAGADRLPARMSDSSGNQPDLSDSCTRRFRADLFSGASCGPAAALAGPATSRFGVSFRCPSPRHDGAATSLSGACPARLSGRATCALANVVRSAVVLAAATDPRRTGARPARPPPPARAQPCAPGLAGFERRFSTISVDIMVISPHVAKSGRTAGPGPLAETRSTHRHSIARSVVPRHSGITCAAGTKPGARPIVGSADSICARGCGSPASRRAGIARQSSGRQTAGAWRSRIPALLTCSMTAELSLQLMKHAKLSRVGSARLRLRHPTRSMTPSVWLLAAARQRIM
jgi:hypothetical protein